MVLDNLVVRDYPRSFAMTPFDRAHTTSCSHRNSCTIIEQVTSIPRIQPTLPTFGTPVYEFCQHLWHQHKTFWAVMLHDPVINHFRQRTSTWDREVDGHMTKLTTAYTSLAYSISRYKAIRQYTREVIVKYPTTCKLCCYTTLWYIVSHIVHVLG